jgi:hypothetical protein
LPFGLKCQANRLGNSITGARLGGIFSFPKLSQAKQPVFAMPFSNGDAFGRYGRSAQGSAGHRSAASVPGGRSRLSLDWLFLTKTAQTAGRPIAHFSPGATLGLVEFSYGMLRMSGNSLTQLRGERLMRANATIYAAEGVKRVNQGYRRVRENFVRSIGKQDGSLRILS